MISLNGGDGIEILETANDGATQNVIAGNEIGTAPGGGYIFGTPDPGNLGNGVEIQNAANNVIGGTSAGQGNVISSNSGDGVDINGAAALGNVIASNIIGLIADGSQVLGNLQQGVAVSSSDTQVGPGNVISANLIGVSISGTTSSGSAVLDVTVIGNLIGTDSTGKVDLGNAFEGVLVDGASGVTIQGNAAGSQVISGNTIGVELEDSASDNLVEGNLIGTDVTGTLELPNSHQGVLIDDSTGNTIGGTGAASKNLISSNHTGVDLEGLGLGQPGRGQPDRHRHHRAIAAGQRGRRRDDRRLVGQHDRRDRRRSGQHHRVQQLGRDRRHHGRLLRRRVPLERDLLQRRQCDRLQPGRDLSWRPAATNPSPPRPSRRPLPTWPSARRPSWSAIPSRRARGS